MNLDEIVAKAVSAKTEEEKLYLLKLLQREILEQENLDFETVLTCLEKIFKLQSKIFNQSSNSLQAIREVVQNIKEKEQEKGMKITIDIGYNQGELYGIFGLDDTFCFAESCGTLFNTRYYLNDVITDNKLTPSFARNYLPWKSGVVDIFGVESYAIPHNKLIDKKLTDIEEDFLLEANNEINNFLKNNKGFVEEVFVKSKNYLYK